MTNDWSFPNSDRGFDMDSRDVHSPSKKLRSSYCADRAVYVSGCQWRSVPPKKLRMAISAAFRRAYGNRYPVEPVAVCEWYSDRRGAYVELRSAEDARAATRLDVHCEGYKLRLDLWMKSPSNYDSPVGAARKSTETSPGEIVEPSGSPRGRGPSFLPGDELQVFLSNPPPHMTPQIFLRFINTTLRDYNLAPDERDGQEPVTSCFDLPSGTWKVIASSLEYAEKVTYFHGMQVNGVAIELTRDRRYCRATGHRPKYSCFEDYRTKASSPSPQQSSADERETPVSNKENSPSTRGLSTSELPTLPADAELGCVSDRDWLHKEGSKASSPAGESNQALTQQHERVNREQSRIGTDFRNTSGTDSDKNAMKSHRSPVQQNQGVSSRANSPQEPADSTQRGHHLQSQDQSVQPNDSLPTHAASTVVLGPAEAQSPFKSDSQKASVGALGGTTQASRQVLPTQSRKRPLPDESSVMNHHRSETCSTELGGEAPLSAQGNIESPRNSRNIARLSCSNDDLRPLEVVSQESRSQRVPLSMKQESEGSPRNPRNTRGSSTSVVPVAEMETVKAENSRLQSEVRTVSKLLKSCQEQLVAGQTRWQTQQDLIKTQQQQIDKLARKLDHSQQLFLDMAKCMASQSMELADERKGVREVRIQMDDVKKQFPEVKL